MNGAILLLPLYAFIVWTETNLPLFLNNNIRLIITARSFIVTSWYLSAYDAVSVGDWVDLGLLDPRNI